MFSSLFALLFFFSTAIYFTFLLLSTFFKFERKGRIILLISLVIGGLGFIFISAILKFCDNFFIRSIYLFLSLFIGLLFYLTIFGAILKFFSFFKTFISRILLARVGVVLASVFFLIGISSTLFIKVRTVEVKINNLPQEWQGKSIVQISDLHLGSIYGSGLLRKLSNKINTLNPDYIFITGDLFDGASGRLAEIGPELKLLKANKKVIFVPGNHDKYLGLGKISGYLTEANILTLKDEAVYIDNLEIIGFDFLDRMTEVDRREINNLSMYVGQSRLLLNHTPLDIDYAKELGVSLQLSGHSHRGQMWPVSMMTRLIYGKYQYGLHTEESYNINTSSGVGTWGPPLRTFNRPEIVKIILK